MFNLTPEARENLLLCFENLFGKNSLNYEVVNMMSDSQLCQYWSLNFD